MLGTARRARELRHRAPHIHWIALASALAIGTIAFFAGSQPAVAGCPGYSASAATISPCVGPPGTTVTVTMRRQNVVPASVSFLTGVNNGIGVGALTAVTSSATGYAFVVPAALCTAGSNSVFAVRLSDSTGQNQGEIGRFTIDCRSGATGATSPLGGGATSRFHDGDFSAAPDPGPFTTYAKGSTAIPGWVVTKATVDLIGTYWVAPGKTRSVDLDGTPGFGAIAQAFATTPGKAYLVTFLFSGNADQGPSVKLLRVSAAGKYADFHFSIARGASAQHHDWLKKSWTFVATRPVTTLQFASLDTTGGQCGPVVARISVARK
jgi:choice-of-anchor C domain-containing protein